MSLPGYTLLESLGRGGMGEVFRARQESLDREVAVKVLRANLPALGWLPERFEREARTMAAMRHPNLLIVHDCLQLDDGRIAIVMELARGGTLRQRLEVAPNGLPFSDAIKWAREIVEGLAAAHTAGIVHRDVKPENILIDESGTARVSDFGMAFSPLADATRFTQAGSAPGTLGYMAPEQFRGEEADQRTDIYSFGVVLYEMFTGRLPQGSFRLVRDLRRDVPVGIDRLIQSALRPEPDQRPADMNAVLEALRSSDSVGSTLLLSRRAWLAAAGVACVGGLSWYSLSRREQPNGSGANSSPEPSWRRIDWPRDLNASSISGSWRLELGSLLSNDAICIMSLMPQMPEQWKVRLRFTRLRGQHSVAVFFRTRLGVASFDLDGWSRGISGVESVGGRTLLELGGFPLSLENGRAYEWTVEIRPDVIRAWLDAEALPERKIAGESLGIVDPWEWKPGPDAPALAIGSWRSETRFEWVEWQPG